MTKLLDEVANKIRGEIELCDYCCDIDTQPAARAALQTVAKWLRSDASGCWDVIDYVRLHDTNTIIHALASHLEKEMG